MLTRGETVLGFVVGACVSLIFTLWLGLFFGFLAAAGAGVVLGVIFNFFRERER